VASRWRIKGGQVIGKTDELGFKITEDPVHGPRLASDDSAFTRYRAHSPDLSLYGRDFRLTDVEGNVIKKMIV